MKQNESMEKQNKRRAEVLDWLDTLVVAILAVVLVFTFALRMVGISGTSMQDTLQNNDRVLISNAFYKPVAGDIVVVSRDYIKNEDGSSPKPIIKRIIATEGQEVYLDYANNKVYVDGVALDEPYIKGELTHPYSPAKNPHTVAEGCVFVLGDHRTVSHDSRSAEVGDIDVRYILGHSLVRIYPFHDMKVLIDE